MKTKNIFWGVLFILAAAFIIVSQLGVAPEVFAGISVWELIVSFLCVAVLIKSIVSISFVGILFPLAFLCIIFSQQLGLSAITPWPVLGTAVLGSIGLSIIFRKPMRKRHKHIGYVNDKQYKYDGNFENQSTQSDISGEEIYMKNRFGAATRYVKSTDLIRADIDASFGEFKIYFDEAKIKGDSATINLRGSFGEVTLYIPKEWNVKNKIDNSFANVSECGSCGSEDGPKVKLTGSMSMGECQIIYV